MPLQSGNYAFKPHEMPIMAGTPASPDHPPQRRLAYLVIGTLLSLVSGFQNGVLSAVLPQLRGDLALDLQQGGWIQAAYFMSYACMSILFFKIRQAYGVQRFVRITLFTLLAANLSQQLHHSYEVGWCPKMYADKRRANKKQRRHSILSCAHSNYCLLSPLPWTEYKAKRQIRQ